MSNSVKTKNSNVEICTSPGKDDWETPQAFFDKLNDEFHFTLDPCASISTAKCKKFYTKAQNGLIQDWSKDVVFMNPPYSTKLQNAFVKKAYDESLLGATVVCLLPARTSTLRFHEYCVKGEIRFLKGRIQFVGAPDPAKFPSMLVIFRPPIMLSELPMFNPYKKENIKPLVNKPALVRMGGKRYLSKLLCEKINQIDHSLYIEPFFGGGRIYFEKAVGFMAIINDVERKITNFNYVVKHFPEEFHALQIQLVKDENTFFDLYDQYHDPQYLQQIQEELRRAKKCWENFGDDDSKWTMAIHASNFYFYCNMAFRGSLTARTMTYPENDPRTEKNRLRWRIFREVRWMKDRMRNTTVLCQDFERVVKVALRYNNHQKLFYFDPPYLKTEGYEGEFSWKDYERLKNCMDQIRPPDYAILSLNDLPELRDLFSGYSIEEVQTHYTTGGAGQRKEATELLITSPWKPQGKRTQLTKWMDKS